MLMEKILFTKYSTERNPEFQIRTDISSDDTGKKFIRKSAYTNLATKHIDNIYSNYEKLSRAYENTNILINNCHRNKDCLEFEFLTGQTLEQKADLLLSQRLYVELTALLQKFVDDLKKSSKVAVFVPSEQFNEVFGDISFPYSLEALEISNIDCVLGNIFIQDEKWALVDYEWVFDFPVPFLYVVYRMIWSYLIFRSDKYLNEANILRLIGIDDKLEACFAQMEQNFQKYVSGKTDSPTYTSYNMLKSSVSLDDMLISHKQTVPALTEQNQELVNQSNSLSERNQALVNQNNSLNEQIAQSEQKNANLSETNNILSEKTCHLENRIAELESQIADLSAQCSHKEALCTQLNDELYNAHLTMQNTLSEAYNLAATKTFKLVHLLNRFKLQFFKGNRDDKKAFIKWLENRGSTPDINHTYNQLFNIIHILESNKISKIYNGFETYNIATTEDNLEIASVTPSPISYSNLEVDPEQKYDKCDIFVLSVIDYNFRYQRPQHFADALAKKGHRVFYVEALFGTDSTSVTQKSDNLWIVNIKNAQALTIHSTDFSKNLDDVMEDIDFLIYKFCIKDCAIIVDYPTWVAPAKILKEKYGFKILADYMDDYTGFEATNGKMVVDCCKELLKISHHVIASSDYLAKAASKYSDNVSIIRNGTEYKHFATADKTIKKQRKVVGYYGAIAHWFDFEKVIYAAENNPDADFVLIGEVTEGFKRLSDIPNIKLLGEIPYKELPKELEKFDVALIPFDTSTDLIKATNPVKFYEYLSACKKVVATDIPELYPFKNKFCYLASSKEEFSDYIKLCLSEKDKLAGKEDMVKFAKQNDWSARADTMENVIYEMFPKVSIVVLTYNNLEYNKLCINSILERTAYPNYELIIVDNMSNDDTPEYLKSLNHPKIKVILNHENLGFAGGNNVGIKAASGKYIMLLNNDTIITAGYITNLIKHLEQDNLKMVGPVTNSIGNESMINIDYEDFKLCHRFSHLYTHTNMNCLYRDIRVLAMFCVAFEKALTEEIGLLDDNYEIGMFEDDDYSMAIQKKGYNISCCEDAFIHHFGSVSFKALEDKKYRAVFEKNKAYFESKWNEPFVPHKYRDTYIIPEN